MAIDLTTITTPQDYEDLTGDNLELLLKGSSFAQDNKNAQRLLYRVEFNVINHIKQPCYNFNDEMLNNLKDKKLDKFKSAIVYETEFFIQEGIESPREVGEYIQDHPTNWLCAATENALRDLGFLTIKSWSFD